MDSLTDFLPHCIPWAPALLLVLSACLLDNGQERRILAAFQPFGYGLGDYFACRQPAADCRYFQISIKVIVVMKAAPFLYHP